MLYCKIEDLNNESDVEQKFIVPLITSIPPQGFGYLNNEFLSKKTIKKLTIDKSGDKRSYKPDFILLINGVPVVVVEAKSPNEKLDEGFREARLYANEINAKFESGVNPCKKVLVSNGKEIWYGNSDNENPIERLVFNDIAVSNDKFGRLVIFLEKDTVNSEIESVVKKIRGTKVFHKPIAILGGRATREEELHGNIFGSTLMSEYQTIFNPDTKEDRINIVKNAYISSPGIVDPIRKIILASTPPSLTNVTKIEDTSKPKELLNKIFGKQRLSNQLLLLIGNVGSGKTTFIEYLRQVVLTKKEKEKTIWIYINLNDSPTSREEIYPWIQNQIIEQLREIYSDINLDHIDELKKIYYRDIKAFEDGEGSLLKDNLSEYNKALVNLIQICKADKSKTTKAYTRYLCGERGNTLILVLDNCDKRSRENQLLMFEVAKWTKEEYQALVFLALRDVTYDLHRTEPPLDTVVKDMTFRIDPPKLSEVLYRRVAYAIEGSKTEISYSLGNNMRVKVSKDQQKKYLGYMLESLYDGTPLAKKIIDGLSGRDIRRGIEIFIAFCRSGHILPEQILKISASGGQHPVDTYIVMRALLRGNKRFYSDSSSYVKNLFQSYPDEEKVPDPFVRVSILKWFEKRKGIRGPREVKGFHKVSELVDNLKLIGHREERILNELIFLLRERCLISEAQIEETLADTDVESIRSNIKENNLIKIAPAGIIHLELLLNLSYIATCAEDVWFEDQKTAHNISEKLTGVNGVGQFSISTVLHNASNLIDYLIRYYDTYFPKNEEFIENDLSYAIDLQRIKTMVEDNKKRFEERNIQLKKAYPFGKSFIGKVISYKQGLGVNVEIGPNIRGLIKERYDHQLKECQPGLEIKVVTIGFDEIRGKFYLELDKLN